VSVVWCQVEVSALGWSLVQGSPTECGVSEFDREASIMRRPWPTRGYCAMEKKTVYRILLVTISVHILTPCFGAEKKSNSKRNYIKLKYKTKVLRKYVSQTVGCSN
jgi:hypothetical protein